MSNDVICINDECPLQDRCYRHQVHYELGQGVDYWKPYDGDEFRHYYPSLHTGDCEAFAAKDGRVHCSMLKKREAKKLVTEGLNALSVEVGKQLRAKNRQRQLEGKLKDRKRAERIKAKRKIRLSKVREMHLNQ